MRLQKAGLGDQPKMAGRTDWVLAQQQDLRSFALCLWSFALCLQHPPDWDQMQMEEVLWEPGLVLELAGRWSRLYHQEKPKREVEPPQKL